MSTRQGSVGSVSTRQGSVDAWRREPGQCGRVAGGRQGGADSGSRGRDSRGSSSARAGQMTRSVGVMEMEKKGDRAAIEVHGAHYCAAFAFGARPLS